MVKRARHRDICAMHTLMAIRQIISKRIVFDACVA
jgi:hypothetical protein